MTPVAAANRIPGRRGRPLLCSIRPRPAEVPASGHRRQARSHGLVSKPGTLTYQPMYELREIGFSSA